MNGTRFTWRMHEFHRTIEHRPEIDCLLADAHEA